ncbi:enolase [Halovivax asiaticus]|nr:enolase [Halovivax asiaticus]
MDYDRIADLPVRIDDVALERRERETSSDFTRVTTIVSLSGPGPDGAQVVGRGEDVTYDADEHDALARTGLPDLIGEYTMDSFSAHVGEVDCFPAGAPDREVFRNYRRWGIESAALDLALRQAETGLASALDRESNPVRFVASTRLGDPPTVDRVESLLDRVPDLQLKLDPTTEWTDAVIDALVDTGAVRILDLKGQYEGTDVDAPADPDLYRRLLEAFSDAVIEDPALTDETRALFDDPEIRSRVSWDAPIHGLDDVRALPWEPDWLNIKPSRFGSLESLFETIEYCRDRDVTMYGGGQFELDVGRGQLQLLASLCYPDGPNDIAPQPYNRPTVPTDLPAPPLSAPTSPVGFRWE